AVYQVSVPSLRAAASSAPRSGAARAGSAVEASPASAVRRVTNIDMASPFPRRRDRLPRPRETRTVYRFDADRLDLAREYKARPFGEHSPDLQYLLNLMRTSETEARHVLVMARPH